MKRSSWLTLRYILLIVTITISFVGQTLHVQAASPAPRGKLFVFIQGLNTNLQSNDPPADTFGKAQGIASYLNTTYPGSNVLMYSYTGDSVNGYPTSYTCQDTFTNGVTKDALLLGKQLQDYLAGKSNEDIYLIAHSFGGLVAYAYLSYLVIQDSENGMLPGTDGDRIAGVVTLDSPLGGIKDELHLARKLLPYLYTIWCPKLIGRSTPAIDDLFNLSKTGISLPLGSSSSIADRFFDTDMTNETVAMDAARQAIHVLTIGNQYDYLYDPAACKLLLGLSIPQTDDFLSSQWLTDQGNSSGSYGRYFADGKPTCDGFTDLAVNHGLVFHETAIQTALGEFVNNQPLTALSPAPVTI